MIIIKLSKKIIQILTIISIISLFPISSHANNDITIDQSFTYEDGLWKPGRIESKDFYINNNKENDISIDRLYMSLKSSEYWKTGEKLDINSNKFKEFAKYSTVTLKHDNNILFQDKFENLLSEDGIKLSKDIDIKSDGKELLNMTIDMDLEMNNDAQALNNVFAIGVAYKIEDTTKPPIDPEKPDPPVDPEKPDPPVDPEKPDPPVDPEKPDPPVDPEKPDPPVDPEKPDPPVDPEKPTAPTNPDTDIDGESDKLPQTGGIVNSASLVVLGAVAIGIGVVLNRKSEEKGGGKHNE